MPEAAERLNAALEGRYTVERELGRSTVLLSQKGRLAVLSSQTICGKINVD